MHVRQIAHLDGADDVPECLRHLVARLQPVGLVQAQLQLLHVTHSDQAPVHVHLYSIGSTVKYRGGCEEGSIQGRGGLKARACLFITA